jgi:UDP-N-acetylmuramate: L-alanyl-gamma-D-glutamyl-meso-diaminopimelate ligase
LLFENYLRGLDFKQKNLLLMSSGNFGGMNLNKLALELNT